ncbi:hypothetical protein LCGC14_2272970 [marine sediment metagenome]|uniref:Uncharacterized protein n=1 Tax=marine sediment metagenome TaxID=412755 RepID=A0A0F9F8Y2_9ZZZZ
MDVMITPRLQLVISLALGGFAAALVSYVLHIRWQDKVVQRQKLENLFSSVKLYIASLHSTYVPVVCYLQGQCGFTSTVSFEKEAMNDVRDRENKMFALAYIYFPNMIELLNNLYRVRVECEGITRFIVETKQEQYSGPADKKERFIELVNSIGKIQWRILDRIIEKADRINNV